MKLLKYFVVIIAITFPNLAVSAIPTNLVFKDQLKIALNSQAPMSQRWIAVMNSFNIASDSEFKQLPQLFEHKDWFIRNAALVAIDKKDKIKAESFATKSIKDRALVVRSAAAEILIKLNSPESLKTILEEVNQPYNFRGKQSLWIRNQMMSYLTTKYEQVERDFYVQQLFDKDEQIAKLSISALEKKTGQIIEEKNTSKKLAAWQNYVKENKWL